MKSNFLQPLYGVPVVCMLHSSQEYQLFGLEQILSSEKMCLIEVLL